MRSTRHVRTAGDIAADESAEDEPTSEPPRDGPAEDDGTDSGPASDSLLPSEAGSGSDDPPRERGGRPPWPVLAALLVGLVVAGVGSWMWWDAAHDDDLALAETRDTVLIQGRQHIETLNTLDYREVDAGLQAWADATTGMMHDQLTSVDDTQRQLLADQKKISEGNVIEAGVLELEGDTATVMAAVEITVVDDAVPDAEPTVKRQRYAAEMREVDGEWKVENLQQVAVSVS